MNLRFAVAISAGIAAAAASVGFGTQEASAQAVMKVGFLVPESAPRGQGAKLMAERLAASKTCDIQVNLFPSSQLGGTTDLIEGMQIGAIEMSILPASFMVGFQPLVGIMDFPFYWPAEYEQLKKIHEGPAMRALLDTTEEKGVVSLAIWYTGYKTWTANKPIVELADYEGLRARVMPSEIIKLQDKLLGMQAVDMPFAETYAALQNGAIDTQENPIDTNYFMKFHEVQDYVTTSNHGTLDQIVSVSKIWWDGLSDDCRSEIRDAVAAGAELTAEKTFDVIENQALPAFEKTGTKVVDVPAETRKAIAAAILPQIRDYYVEQNGDAAAQILSAFDAEIGNE